MSNHIYHKLSQPVLTQIQALHDVCVSKKQPGPSLLGLVLPEADLAQEDTFYALYYIEKTPVSFLSCFCPDGVTAEISGFTHPDFRNQGFFSCLLRETKKEAQGLFGTVTYCFQCLSSDPDTAAFCKARGLTFSHAECMMEWQQKRPAQSTGPASFKIRLLHSSDLMTLANLHGKAFDCPMVFSKDYIHTVLEDPDTVSCRILAGKKTVGLLHLTSQKQGTDGQEESFVYLMGLGILPQARRQGFAEAALQSVFDSLPEHSRLVLQVSTSNKAAFRLYEKTGFEISSRLDYYTVKTDASSHTAS